MTEQILEFKNALHHKEWYKILDNKELRKIVVAAPRNHAKSSCLSENFPLQEMVRDCNIRILIVSNTSSQAELHLRNIKARIERDEKYQKYAGDLIPRYPEKWTDKEIIINRTDTSLKDATVSTVGAGGAILTRRADLIICDDVLDQDNTKTQEQRNKVKNWFYQVLLPVLEPKTGRMIFMGTVWHKDDLLNQLLEDPTCDFRTKYEAIINDSERKDLWDKWIGLLEEQKKEEAKDFFRKNKDEMYRGVKVLWQERMDYDELYLLRRTNRVAFEKSYQNNAEVTEEEKEIKNDWIQYYDDMPSEQEVAWSGTGVDLAISQKETADCTAMVSGKLAFIDGKPIVFVVPNPINERISHYKTLQRAEAISKSLGNGMMTPLWVEDVAYQRSTIQDMEQMGLPAEGIRVSNDKRARLRTISGYIQSGRVLFPKRDADDLIYQLTGFGAESHDDLVDAFVFMVTALMNLGAGGPKVTVI